MKKFVLWTLTLLTVVLVSRVQAEEAADQAVQETAAVQAPVVTEPAPVVAEPVVVAEPTPVVEPAAPAEPAPAVETVAAPVEAPASENLEFISGEVTALDEAAKTISVKLYGEAETDAADKILTIQLDENTDLTDGEKDRDLKSLSVGTEVDVEYDPASNKATYIFVY